MDSSSSNAHRIDGSRHTFFFRFVFDLVAFFVVGLTSLLVVVIGPGGVEGSVGSVDILS